MIRWGIQSILSEGLGLVASYSGVAFAFLLVMFFGAVFNGESDRITAYPTKVNADVWVMQKGVANMHMAMSQLWDWKEDRVRAIEGVAATESILYMNAVINASDREWFSYIVGLTGRTEYSGPWAMYSGKRIPDRGEVVVPDVMARLTGLQIGDSIDIVDHSFTIVGLSAETFSMANSIVFVSYADLADIMTAEGTVSYVMVRANEDVNPADLAQRIRNELDKVNALPQQIFISNDHHMAMQMGVEIIAMMSVIGSVLAMVIVAFTSHAFIVRRKRDLAIAKALGYRNRQIYTSVLIQTLLLTLTGFLLSIVLALLLFPLITLMVPAVSLKITLTSILQTGVAAILVAALAVIWSVKQVVNVDPLTVFHS
ncbi:MAG: ABC transporter permease [Gammaproteobacteria bacterium]|nr:ABC transporter permease [Gammaproteobacteria bacterium]